MATMRKDLYNGQLVVSGMGPGSSVYKVVETAACNMYGTLEKRGRYVAVRRWAVGKGDFAKYSPRTGYKPSDLYRYDEWVATQALREKKIIKAANTHGAEARAVMEFFDGLGAPELVKYTHDTVRDGNGGIKQVVTGWRIESYPWRDSWNKVMVELGVIEASDDDEEA